MLLKTGKDLSFETKVDFIMKASSYQLNCSGVSSVGAFSVKPFLAKSCQCPWQCTPPLCTEGTVHEFSIFRLCYRSMFFQYAQKLPFSFVSLLVFWGAGGEGVGGSQKKHLAFESFFLLQVIPQP